LLNQIFKFLTNKKFILNLIGIFAFLMLVIFLVLQWLKIYTHHGQKLEMPNYINSHIKEADSDAQKRSFQMIVNDSVHIVGKPGGIIQNQEPKGGSKVKENRKIYVTVTKYKADIIDIASIFPLYGQDYESKRSQLQQKSIATEIKEWAYDPYTTGTIMEVWHDDQKIIDRSLNPKNYKLERGSKLFFVVSTPEGGAHIIPDLRGMTVNEARFIAETNKLTIGDIAYSNNDVVNSIDDAIIISQYPESDGISTLTTGGAITITIKAP
jgi:beta-lactam-binding protein with PASTA domain